MKKSISVAFLALLLFSCATGPTKQFVRTGPSHDTKLPNINTVAIVADVCLLRDVAVGDRYWSIKESRDAEAYMIDSARTALISKGYDVAFVEAPFVGAFMNSANMQKFATEPGNELGEMHPPLFVAEGIATDPVCRKSLTAIIPRVLGAVAQRSKLPSDICCTGADMKDAINTVAKSTGGDAILFLSGQGVIVPAGKSVAQGVATGVLTTALTLGMFTYAKWSVSYLDTYAAFVDAGTGEILWSNSLRLKGSGFTDKDYYSEKWPYNILYHIPARAQLKMK